MQADNLEKLNREIDQSKMHIERMEALERLKNNKDFKIVVEEGYFLHEAAELAASIGAPEIVINEGSLKIAKSLLKGISGFQQYLNKVNHQGNLAKQRLEDQYQTRDEIMAEAH